jgi:predicted Zn-dependent protease
MIYTLDLNYALPGMMQAAAAEFGRGKDRAYRSAMRRIGDFLDRLDARFPHDIIALQQKVNMYRQLGDLDAAVKTLDIAIGRAPLSADLRFIKAQLLTEQGKVGQAEAALAAARDRRDPKHVPEAYRDLARELAKKSATSNEQ